MLIWRPRITTCFRSMAAMSLHGIAHQEPKMAMNDGTTVDRLLTAKLVRATVAIRLPESQADAARRDQDRLPGRRRQRGDPEAVPLRLARLPEPCRPLAGVHPRTPRHGRRLRGAQAQVAGPDGGVNAAAARILFSRYSTASAAAASFSRSKY